MIVPEDQYMAQYNSSRDMIKTCRGMTLAVLPILRKQKNKTNLSQDEHIYPIHASLYKVVLFKILSMLWFFSNKTKNKKKIVSRSL